jgi:hypothetical protein
MAHDLCEKCRLLEGGAVTTDGHDNLSSEAIDIGVVDGHLKRFRCSDCNAQWERHAHPGGIPAKDLWKRT